MKRNVLRFTKIWFVVEGERRPFRCHCHSGLFRILEKNGMYSKVQCIYKHTQRVLSGFSLEGPELPERTDWLGVALKGEQLRFEFRGRVRMAKGGN